MTADRPTDEPSRPAAWWTTLDRGWQASVLGLVLLAAVHLLV